jgi:hypothetical protein
MQIQAFTHYPNSGSTSFLGYRYESAATGTEERYSKGRAHELIVSRIAQFLPYACIHNIASKDVLTASKK